MYSFDRDALIKAIPRPEKVKEARFEAASAEVLDRILQITDNAGATDERRIWIDCMGPWSKQVIEEIKRPQAPVADRPIATGVLGHPAYFAPRAQPFVDLFALSDPFLARWRPLPYGRPGHPYRPLPPDVWAWRDPGEGAMSCR